MDIAAKRVFDEAAGRARLAVATGQGLAIVGISGDAVGEFGLALPEPVRAVAPAGDGQLIAATDEDVELLALDPDAGVADTRWRGTVADVPAEAVAVLPTGDATVAGAAGAGRSDGSDAGGSGGAVVAARADGTVRRAALADLRRIADGETGPGEPAPDSWMPIGEATVRAADGRLLAAEDGVYRVDNDGIEHVGLADVRDVAAAGPFAATGEGCYRLGPGWTAELGGPIDLVSARRAAPGAGGGAAAASDGGAADAGLGTAHAAHGAMLYARDPAGEWSERSWPVAASVAGLAYGRPAGPGGALQTVAADGTVCVDDGDGWRTRSIGLPDVRDCAVVI